MKIERKGKSWTIDRRPSIFTSRNGREDVWIRVESDHGVRRDDGKLYSGVQVIAVESGEMIRNYGAVPKDLTLDFLKQSGFVDI